MKTPLIKITIRSIYKVSGVEVPLPQRMALCTPDTQAALFGIRDELLAKRGDLVLSDLFRSYEMQLQSHNDWASGRKKAFSPPPGGSLHEAGRAFDFDLSQMKVKLPEFWEIAQRHGAFPIVARPDPKLSESWHFDVRGSHQAVYDYYRSGKGGANMKAYTAMAVSGILAIGVRVDAVADRMSTAFLQSALIRLGHDPGPIDGRIGLKTNAALEAAEIAPGPIEAQVLAAENLLQTKFPNEFGPEPL